MARQVTTNKPNVSLPNGVSYPNTGSVVILTDQQWNIINPGSVGGGKSITDNGNIATTSP